MENRKCQVNLAGIGMGSKGTLTEEVRKIIAESDVLIGAGLSSSAAFETIIGCIISLG